MQRAILLAAAAAIAVLGIYSVTAVDKSVSPQVVQVKMPANIEGLSVATFAGGCFWCVESAFEAVPGVREAISGFSGGDFKNPTYRQVALGLTNHTEAVQVYYDPKVITYEGLLQVLWRTADPTDSSGQFSDRGPQYRPAIFYHDEEQKRVALRAREELARSHRYNDPVTIEIVAFKAFYPAEQDHQDYYLKNPWRYGFYSVRSGRTGFQKATWGKDLKIDFDQYRPLQRKEQHDRSIEATGM